MPKQDKQEARINHHDLSDSRKKCLKKIVDICEKECSWVRKQQIKQWKKNDEFWHGIQFVFWSESKQDWSTPIEGQWFEQEEGGEQADGPFYDFVVNIYKSHGESIIAALSAQLPTLRFPPDNAEDPDDVSTARTYDKLVDLIQRHNKAKILLLDSLLKFWNHGICFAYHAPKSDKAFGIIQIPKYKMDYSCSKCGMSKSPSEKESDNDAGEMDDSSSDVEGGDPETSVSEEKICLTCGSPMQKITIIDGFDEAVKTRIIVETYSPLECKVSYYAKDQKDCGYLTCTVDLPRALLKSIHPHVKEEINNDLTEMGAYERLARTPSSYSASNYPDENDMLRPYRRIWLRPWQFEVLDDDLEADDKKWFQKEFPNGCAAVYIADTYVGCRNEDMDKYWTIGKAGLSKFIHSDALGQPLIPIQELSNITVNLTAETIEQGIPASFADSDVLDFENYGRHEARPGWIYPVRPKTPGGNIGQSFYEQSRATLSREVPLFWDRLDKLGQFVVGSFPSLFGGPGEGKSRTAAEYNMSRQMALQRLSIAWSYLTNWWGQLMEKCVHLYVENMAEDEYFTKKSASVDDYVKVWIKRAEMEGHVGEVEVEGSESFPVSMPQKQSLFMKILEMNNEFLNAAAFNPVNRSIVADILGFPEFDIPGRDQQIKQMREIEFIIKQKTPVIPEQLVDDDQIHMAVLQHFMVSAQGMDLEETNPPAYKLLLEHLEAHNANIIQKTMGITGGTPPGVNPDQQPDQEPVAD